MGKLILKDASVVVNSVDLSNHADKVTIETKFDDVDLTSFGDIYKEHGQGMGDATITVEFFQDYAAGSVDATLWPLSQSGATFPLVIKPTSAAVGATNPSYTMTAVLLDYSPLDGSVGDASKTSVQFVNGAQSGLVRATS